MKEEGFLRLLKDLLKLADTHLEHQVRNEAVYHQRNAIYLLYLFVREQLLSIIMLCEKLQASAAVSLLRNTFEAILTAFYLSGRGSKKRLGLYAVNGIQLQVKSLRGFLGLVMKYPNLRDKDALTDEQRLRNGIVEKLNDIKTLRKNHRLKKSDVFPSFEAMSQKCDQSVPEKFRKGNTEYTYNLFYRYSSTHVHPTTLALGRFIVSRKSEEDLNEAVLTTAAVLLLDFLKLLKRKGLFRKEANIGRFTRCFNRIRKQPAAVVAGS